jgi:uncharacterized membrane-anchored protein
MVGFARVVQAVVVSPVTSFQVLKRRKRSEGIVNLGGGRVAGGNPLKP